jgi:hypothetical protein
MINKLNQILAEKRTLLNCHERTSPEPRLPVVFIVGLPRSGTTPLAQMLIQRFRLGYASNLIARFWNAPELGIILTREISADPGGGSSGLESKYGSTSGYEGHHEFGYFWRRWFDFRENHCLDQDAQSRVDIKSLQKALSVMEYFWERPLFFKNPAALPLQTAFLARIFPTSLFVYIKRDHIPVAVSLFNGRQKHMDDPNRWFSIKPSEYIHLKDRSIPEQIAGQVYYTQREINRQLDVVPDQRRHDLSFPDLCRDPDNELDKIRDFLTSACDQIYDRDVSFSPLTPETETMDSSLMNRIVERLNILYGEPA